MTNSGSLRNILALCLLTILRVAACAQQPGAAKLIDLKGEVRIQLPQQTLVPASREMLLPPGTMIATAKGSALVLLSDGSQVLVKSNSNLVLKSPENSKTFFELLLGKIRASVTKRSEGAPSFRLGTPTAVITVRGTKFEVTVDKHLSTSVQVFEGVVEVAGIRFTTPVLLGPGYFTRVREDEPAEAPQYNAPSVRREGGAGSSDSRGDWGRQDRGEQRGTNGASQDDRTEHEHEFE